MAKMGFTAPNTHFGASTSFHPYLWLCRSRTQFYSFSTYGRVFCRLQNDVPQSAKDHVSSRNVNDDVVQLKHRSTYATVPDKETEMRHMQRINIPYPQWESSHYNRNFDYRVENCNEVHVGMLHPGHTAEDWGRATEEFRMKKKLFTQKNVVGESSNEFPEVYVAENPMDKGQGIGLSMEKNKYNRSGSVHAFQDETDTTYCVYNRIVQESPQFSHSPSSVFSRQPNDVLRSTEEFVSSVNANTAVAQWSQKSNYNTGQRRSNIENPQFKKYGYRNKCEEVSDEISNPEHTALDSVEVTEDYKKKKISVAKRNPMIANTKQSAELAEKFMNEDQSDSSNIAVESPSISKSVPSIRTNHKKKKIISDDNAHDTKEARLENGQAVCIPETVITEKVTSFIDTELLDRLSQVYDKVLVVDSISAAKKAVSLLTGQYRDLIHACDTEVANIDVKQETPVDHGEVICFSIYSGPNANYGNGKSCIWVDVLDGGGEDILKVFAPFFEDHSIKKVWHNYSFDNHVIENYGIKLSGFHADTMHMARLWNSARRTEGGYSLEALTGDSAIMSDSKSGLDEYVIGKISMKTIFGRKKLKKDGSEGKILTIPPVSVLQRVERKFWICYSALDSISTLKLYESLEKKLRKEPWCIDGAYKGCMFGFYQKYFRPFGELLVKMETEGMLVDRTYLAEIEKVAIIEQQIASERFRKWASKYCPDAKYMNVGSDAQLRQFFFGGVQNSKDQDDHLPLEKDFKVANVDNILEEGKKSPSKLLKITLRKADCVKISTDQYTASGWPSVSGNVLKALSGKVSSDFYFIDEEEAVNETEASTRPDIDIDTSGYGTAYAAFGGGQEGIEACHAIAALCEVCSIGSLISNFILPLQGHHISGTNGRIHCSLNINTETGRLSARRPNLQNQPALEKDRYKIRQAFIAATGKSLIVADYGQLELRILAHLANCKSMLDAFKAGGDFHSRTAMNMYSHIRDAVEQKKVLLEWHPQPGEDKPPVPLLKDAFASERRKAKMLNFSIAYGKTTVGLARDWKVSREEAQETVDRWYSDRKEVLTWQQERKIEAKKTRRVHTLLGRARHFPSLKNASPAHKNHIERAAINTPVQGSAADVAMCAMLEISRNVRLQELGWKLILQVHDEVILEGPTESGEEAKSIVVNCMSKPFNGENFLRVDLSVDAKCAQNWYSAK